MKNYKTVTDLYEDNWKNMSGLQMTEKIAKLGFEWVSELPKGKALDIGCGDGTNARSLKELGFDVSGCEISQNAVKKAIKNGIDAKVVDLNSSDFPYKSKSFQFIWLSDVIEHVFWPDQLMSNVEKSLKEGGYLFISTPNVSWFIFRLQLLMGMTLQDFHAEHIHWFNQKRLIDILKRHNLEIVKTAAYKRFAPYPVVQKFTLLDNLNYVGDMDDLFSYTYAILAKKK